jgi:CheY-like chemotaxis protein
MNPHTASSSGIKILVVDDNPIIQRTVYFALRDKGYKVLMSASLSDAFKIVRDEHPVAILLDLNFPPEGATGVDLSDGFRGLEWFHRMPETKGIPIIVISSDAPEKSEARALAAGAAAYFHKPIDKDKLAAKLGELLSPPSPPAP